MARRAYDRPLRTWAFPVVGVAVLAIVGDGLAYYLAGGPAFAVLAAIGLLIAFVPFLSSWRWLGIGLIALVVAHARADLAYRPLVPASDVAALDLPGMFEIEAEIARPPELRDGGLRLVVSVSALRGRGYAGPASGRVLLQIRHAEQEWTKGDTLRGWVRLRRPRNFGNPGEFDYESYLARRGIAVTSFVYRDAELTRTPAAGVDLRDAWRSGVARLFATHVDESAAPLLSALVLGMGPSLSADVRENFARAGVSHILAVSGLHVGFVAAVGYASIRWLFARSEWLLLHAVVPKIAAAFAAVPVLLYAGIAGSNVATGRAVGMAALVFGSVLVDRQRHLPIALALAALVALLWMPGVSSDVSFQLSFVAVAALLVAMERFQRWWPVWEDETLLRLRPRRAWFLRIVATYAVVSVAALAATTPLVAYHFNRVSLVAPLANVVVTPLLGSIVVPLGLLSAMAYPFSSELAVLLAQLAAQPAALAAAIVPWIANLPGASLRVASPSFAALVFAYGAAALALFGGRRTYRWAVAVAIGGLVMLGIGQVRERLAPAELRVTFLSVGQGDSAVIEFPTGEVIVVDGGGLGSLTFDVGERIVAPFLWQRGIRTVDTLVVSHPDWDHYGGLKYLAQAFAPREVWGGDDSSDSAAWRRFRAAVDAGGARWVAIERGFSRRIGDVSIEALWPTVAAGSSTVNDRSVVLAIDYAGERILLTGDIEARSEGALLATGAAALRSRVMKAPHHGSATSSTAPFIAAVSPELAIVSTGYHNRFGFPDRGVMRRYARVGSRVLRTDWHGAITVAIRADGVATVRTWQRTMPERHAAS